ncbi:MAG: ribosome-binding factor A [Opitutales bacterium]
MNELLRRELSQILHTQYQEMAVFITITEVAVAPDLRQGRVFYSVLGEEANVYLAEQFFSTHRAELQQRASRHITLKYFPQLRFEHDKSIERGNEVLRILDELEQDGQLGSNPSS